MRPTYHPNLFQRAIMGLTAIIALAIAYGGLTNPAGFLEGMQLSAIGEAGINETRGQYGGFFLMLGGYTALGAFGIIRPSSVLGLLCVLYGGVFFGRVVHLAYAGIDGLSTYPIMMQAIHLIDLTGLVLSVLALRMTAQKA